MVAKLTEVSIDCADLEGLARFWCAVLGYEVQGTDEELVAIGPPSGPGDEELPGPVAPQLVFNRVPEAKTVKNRVHLDVNPTDRDRDDEVARLLDLGARRIDIGQGEASWVVLSDPEGNEFCVLGTRRP